MVNHDGENSLHLCLVKHIELTVGAKCQNTRTPTVNDVVDKGAQCSLINLLTLIDQRLIGTIIPFMNDVSMPSLLSNLCAAELGIVAGQGAVVITTEAVGAQGMHHLLGKGGQRQRASHPWPVSGHWQGP